MKELNDSEYLKIFGKRIKSLRKERELTQAALGAKANLEKSAIQRIERGYNSTLKTLRKVACALEISMSDMFSCK